MRSAQTTVLDNVNTIETDDASKSQKMPLVTMDDETDTPGLNPTIDLKSVSVDNALNASGLESDEIIIFQFNSPLPKTAAELPSFAGSQPKTLTLTASVDFSYFSSSARISSDGPEILFATVLYGEGSPQAKYQTGQAGRYSQTFTDAKTEGGPGFDYVLVTYPYQNLKLPKSTVTFNAWVTADSGAKELGRDALENSHFTQTVQNTHDLKLQFDQREILPNPDKKFAGKNIVLTLPVDKSARAFGINSLGENNVHIIDTFGHAGWDFYYTESLPVRAAASGTVVASGRAPDETAKENKTDQWAVTVLNEADGYYNSYIHLESINPDLKIGQAIKTGDLIGYTLAENKNNPDSPSLHWTFGYYSDQAKRDWAERQQPGGQYTGIFPHFTEARCPLRYLDAESKQAILANWAALAGSDTNRKYFPKLCSNYYRDPKGE